MVRRPSSGRQRAAWEALERLGSVSAVAAEWGCTPQNIGQHIRAYARNAGEPVPVLRKPSAGVSSIIAELQAIAIRLELLEQAMERLDRHVHERPPQLVEWHPDHRRIVDGGEHTRTQRRRIRAGS